MRTQEEWTSFKDEQRCQGLLQGNPCGAGGKNRHFRVGSSRNIPDITLPRLLELAVFASSRGAAESVHAA
ncbi:hypothetical protein GCM10019060_17030 [Novosphingobium pokkalii]|nr:hypothetical protein GCM10019060_17030 [Novosphingobium pokkalii]